LIGPLDTVSRYIDFVDLDNDGDLNVVDASEIHRNEGTPKSVGPFSSPVSVGPMVSVTTLDNSVDEVDRSFEARIYNAEGAPIASRITGPIVIRDDD